MARLLPQVVDAMRKSPLMAGALSVAVAVPVLDKVTACAAEVVLAAVLLNKSEAGAKARMLAPWPLPVSMAVCAVLSSGRVSVPERAPSAVGVKVTVIAQLVAAARLLPQVVPVTRKSPLATGAARPMAASPVLDTAIVRAAL